MSLIKRFGVMGVAAGLLALAIGFMSGQASASAAAPCQGGSPQEWQSFGGGSWTCDGATTVGHSAAGDTMLLSGACTSDFDLSADASTNREATLAFRVRDQFNGYMLVFMPDGVPGYPSGLWVVRRTGGVESYIWNAHPFPFANAGQSANIRVVGTGSTFQVIYNGANLGSVVDGSVSSGWDGLRVYGDGTKAGDARFTNVRLTCAGQTTPPSGSGAWCDEQKSFHVDGGWWEWPAGCGHDSHNDDCDDRDSNNHHDEHNSHGGWDGGWNGGGWNDNNWNSLSWNDNGGWNGNWGGNWNDGWNNSGWNNDHHDNDDCRCDDDHHNDPWNNDGWDNGGWNGNNWNQGNGNWNGNDWDNNGHNCHDVGNNSHHNDCDDHNGHVWDSSWNGNSWDCHDVGNNNHHNDCDDHNGHVWDSSWNGNDWDCHNVGNGHDGFCDGYENGHYVGNQDSGCAGEWRHACWDSLDNNWDPGSSCGGNVGNDHHCGQGQIWDQGFNGCHGDCGQNMVWDSGLGGCHNNGGGNNCGPPQGNGCGNQGGNGGCNPVSNNNCGGNGGCNPTGQNNCGNQGGNGGCNPGSNNNCGCNAPGSNNCGNQGGNGGCNPGSNNNCGCNAPGSNSCGNQGGNNGCNAPGGNSCGNQGGNGGCNPSDSNKCGNQGGNDNCEDWWNAIHNAQGQVTVGSLNLASLALLCGKSNDK